jgi:hypothetical protein
MLRCSVLSSGHRQKGKKTMFERVKSFIRTFHIPTAEELEREYLNGAANRIDLEFRQRQIDRGMFRNFGA